MNWKEVVDCFMEGFELIFKFAGCIFIGICFAILIYIMFTEYMVFLWWTLGLSIVFVSILVVGFWKRRIVEWLKRR